MVNATDLVRSFLALTSSESRSTPVSVRQERTLAELLQRAAHTRFGRDHRFAALKTVEDYQAAVPLRRYEQFWTEYWKPAFPRLEHCSWPGLIPYFAVSSGTTSGTTKYIPLSMEMIRSNNRAGTDLLRFHLRARPQSRMFGGKTLVLGGSTELVQEAPGILSGDLSGIATLCIPWWAKPFYYPDARTALLKNWEEKIDRLARDALRLDIRALSGVPSWLLILFEKLFELRPDARGNLHKIFPHLEMVIHGGVNFKPYYEQFRKLLGESPAELREVYPASEGFIAVADRGFGEGLRVILDHGIFYEFVPVEELDSPSPTRHWLKNIETGVNYAVVLTTCAGLWSYVLGDTVRFVDRDPPRLLITGRTAYSLSAFGEHLIGEEIEDAVSEAAAALGVTVTDYSVGSVFPSETDRLGGHRYYVECEGGVLSPEQCAAFASRMDEVLVARNEDYQAHRAEGYGMRAPEVVSVPPGTFAQWMKSRGKLGGQHKVPRIINDQDLFRNLELHCAGSASR